MKVSFTNRVCKSLEFLQTISIHVPIIDRKVVVKFITLIFQDSSHDRSISSIIMFNINYSKFILVKIDTL